MPWVNGVSDPQSFVVEAYSISKKKWVVVVRHQLKKSAIKIANDLKRSAWHPRHLNRIYRVRRG